MLFGASSERVHEVMALGLFAKSRVLTAPRDGDAPSVARGGAASAVRALAALSLDGSVHPLGDRPDLAGGPGAGDGDGRVQLFLGPEGACRAAAAMSGSAESENGPFALLMCQVRPRAVHPRVPPAQGMGELPLPSAAAERAARPRRRC